MHGGDAAPEQLGHREVDAGAARLLVLGPAADRQHLEEARVPELRAAAVLDERAVERRAAEVGVGGDQAGRDDAVGRVDRLVDRAVEARADVEDAVALDHDHAVPEQAVAAAVEGDDPAGPNSSPPRLSHARHLLVEGRARSRHRRYRARRKLTAPSAGFAGAIRSFPGGRLRKGGRAPLRVNRAPLRVYVTHASMSL